MTSSKYTTVKSTPKGKYTTLAIRQARAGKRMPDAVLTRSGHIKAIGVIR